MFVIDESFSAKRAYEISKKAKEKKQQKEIIDIFSKIKETAQMEHIEYGTPIIHNEINFVVDLMEILGYKVYTYENAIIIGWNLDGNNQS